MSEADYWKSFAGADYNEMFAGKYEGEHAAQCVFLLGTIFELGKDRPRVLEYGCGTGRLAKLLAPHCAYFGFDFSPEMVKPLQLAIDDGLEAELVDSTNARYDLAFTASVLIHNPPEIAAAIVKRLLRCAPVVLLIENKKHNGPSEKTSPEHNGCWVHDYASWGGDAVASTVKHIDLCKTHDVYEFHR